MQLIFSIAVILTGMLAGSSLFAQSVEDSLRRYPPKTVEVTASKPDDISIVDARAIEVKPTSALRALTASMLAGNALRAMSSSLDIRSYGAFGSAAVPSFRGLPAEYTQVYRDGILLTNDQLGQTDLGQLSLHGTSHVELISASTAVLLGGEAIGASIGIQSSFPDSLEIRIGSDQTNYEHGSGFATNEYYASIAERLCSNVSILATASSDHSTGAFPFYQVSSEQYVLRENADASLRSASFGTRWLPDERSALKVVTTYFSADRGVPGEANTPGRGATFLAARQEDEQLLTAAIFSREWDNWSGRFSLSYQDQFESFRNPIQSVNDTSNDKIIGASASAHATMNDWLGGYFGLSYARTALGATTNRSREQGSAISRDRLTSYLAAAISAAKNVQISTSIRSEYISDIEDQSLLPQLVAEWQPVQVILVSAAYSRCYHAPTLNDLYWRQGGNPNLQIERGDNWQAAIEYHPELPWATSSISATYFHALIENEIVWHESGGYWTPLNVLRAQSSGLEVHASIDALLLPRLSVHLEESVTLLSALNLTTSDSVAYGKELPYSTPVSSLLTIQLEHSEWGGLAALVRSRGHKYSLPSNTSENQLPAVTMCDVTYSSPDMRFEQIGFKALLSILNLTNRQYAEIENYPMPGRNYKFSIELNYH